jgi:hypothetical protein
MTSLINAYSSLTKNIYCFTKQFPKKSFLCHQSRQISTKIKLSGFKAHVKSTITVSNRKYWLGFLSLTGVGATAYYSNKYIDVEFVSNLLNKLLRGLIYANCQDNTTQANRLKHYSKPDEKNEKHDKNEANTDDQFDWLEFIKMLYKERIYFLAAVVVCIICTGTVAGMSQGKLSVKSLYLRVHLLLPF